MVKYLLFTPRYGAHSPLVVTVGLFHGCVYIPVGSRSPQGIMLCDGCVQRLVAHCSY